MQAFPAGTMLVYTQWLYLGLIGCAVLGFSLGLLCAFTFFNCRCVSCYAEDYEVRGYLSQDEEV